MKNEATINIKEATTSELVEFYNANLKELPVSAKKNPVKKFADRKTAEKRVAVLVEDLELIDSCGEVNCPNCGIHLGNGWSVDGTEVNGETLRHKEFEFVCLGCGDEFGPEVEAKRAVNNSAGIAKSWENPEVAAKRVQRSAVEVDGVYYGSVKKAYIDLDLDLKDHIQFRMLLKENGKAKVEGRKWKIIPLNYDK